MKENRSTTPESIKPYKRLAKALQEKGDSRTIEYYPSRTELLLEEMCQSLGTQLEPAYVNPLNGNKLVRLSKPVVLVNKHTDEKSLLAMQHTRFSPFNGRDINRVVEIYKEATRCSPDVSFETVVERISREIEERGKRLGKKSDYWIDVIDNRIIPDVGLARWRKGIYFAVFKLGGNDLPQGEIEPFLIHEDQTAQGTPDVSISFDIKPLFIQTGYVEGNKNMYDSFLISFPRIHSQHRDAIDLARARHSLDKLKTPSDKQQEPYKEFLPQPAYYLYEISSHLPRELSMGFIQSYLRKLCLGTSL